MTNGSGDSRTMGSGPLFGDAAKAAMARGGSGSGPQGTRAPADSDASADPTEVGSAHPGGTRPARDDRTVRASLTDDDRTARDRRASVMPPTRVPPGASASAGANGSGTTAGGTVGTAARRPMTVGTAPVARKKGRRARLTVKRIDPWTTLKFSFVYGLAGMVVLLVTVIVLYGVVDAMGIIDSIRTFIGDVSSNDNGSSLIVWLGFSRVMLVAVVIGAINVVLFTAFATLTAFIYNVCTDIVGGVEVTLAERS